MSMSNDNMRPWQIVSLLMRNKIIKKEMKPEVIIYIKKLKSIKIFPKYLNIIK